MNNQIYEILNEMSEVLNISQMKRLQTVLIERIESKKVELSEVSNEEYLDMFLTAKQLEGCSNRTIQYYKITIESMFKGIKVSPRQITTEILRDYLVKYQQKNNCSKVTVDNVRRNLSSFFSWLEEEDHILKSPVRRIHKIKTKKVVKEVISEECIETLRDNCKHIRDLAIIDILISTGMRVGELVNINKSDVNFEERECIVYGKGDKERKVYFDARTKLHLLNYLNTRKDDNGALFVTLNYPYDRLKISGVETRLRMLGRSLNIMNIHPHKFRRTMATKAIDKGMPIEQVQKLLGHQQIDTTMHYAMVSQSNVKSSHRKYIS